jgi:hypothetical protein
VEKQRADQGQREKRKAGSWFQDGDHSWLLSEKYQADVNFAWRREKLWALTCVFGRSGWEFIR